MFESKPSAAQQRLKVPKSTWIVGGVALLLLAMATAISGMSGLFILSGVFALLTGLYVLITGRRSWALIPGGRKVGAAVLVGSLVLLSVGGAAAPSPTQQEMEAAAASKEQDSRATSKAATPASASPTATPTPTATEAGPPLDPDAAVEPAGTAGFTAPRSQPAYATKALDLLGTLPIKGRAPKTGYDRAQFGQPWADVDRNGCDTRNDTLKRDLTQVAFTNSVPCKVQSGMLADPYTGKAISFVRGTSTSTAVQIDHVVALSDAWQKGAQQLSVEQRTAFANDPLNLQSTDGPTNLQKGAGDAATWLPPNKANRCEYVARQISVKATYSLWVTQAEHDAMARVLGDCAGQLAPTNEQPPAPQPVAPAPAAPVAPVVPAPAPAPAVVVPAPAPAAAYYANCTAVKQAGAAPILAGQPGYSRSLDRDGDGIACEK